MRSRPLCFLIVGLAISAGCTSGEGAKGQSEPNEPRLIAPAGDAGVPAQVAHGLDVLRANYVEAVQHAAECMEQKGWTVGDVFAVPSSNRVTFDLLPAPKAAVNSPAHQGVDDWERCHAAHVNEIEQMYLDALAPTGTDRKSQVESLPTCLERVGVEGATASSSEEELVQAIVDSLPETALSPGFACLDAHSLLFRQRSFGNCPWCEAGPEPLLENDGVALCSRLLWSEIPDSVLRDHRG
jgi:hypothetical protein